ncbi:MAG TPA: DUF711 family protein [Anaerolineales bacterium]|nr:DUF711 family protein [Anaerolineales bacterium]
MKIRSITYFFNPHWPSHDDAMRKAGEFIALARPAFESGGLEVQTTRLATIPFPQLLADHEVSEAVYLAQSLESAARLLGYEYISIGPAVADTPASYAVIPDILANTNAVFAAGIMASPESGIDLSAVRACAEVIQRSASISSDGFANLRFAALANVPPGVPFFPAAYHEGDQPTFALATESADLAVEAVAGAANLKEARRRLVSSIETQAQSITRIGNRLAERLGLQFDGIDFSFAPFPDRARSFGEAMERLGVSVVGMHGSLAAAAFLADALDRANFKRAGFNGLFLPVLEDAVLAARAAEGNLGITEILLYSAVCGSGLDTLPLPGEVTSGQLASILLDLAALAQRLEKPLTARLMPIPGKVAGDPTGFDFPYFANSRVLAVKAEDLGGLLAGEETVGLRRRKTMDG